MPFINTVYSSANLVAISKDKNFFLADLINFLFVSSASPFEIVKNLNFSLSVPL